MAIVSGPDCGNFFAKRSFQRIVTHVQIHALNILLLACVIASFAPPVQAADDNFERAVARADHFLSTDRRAKATLNYVHFGTDYRGQQFRRIADVTNDGEFSLVYRLFWNDDGVTDIAYFCHANGTVYGVKIAYTNAEGNVPFLWANVSIQVLGNLFIEAYKDKLSDDDRKLLQKMVDNADAKGMLEWSLRLDQFFSNN